MAPVKVFMAGGDGMGWALDDDLSLTRQALGDTIRETEFDDCDVVHSVWWEGLLGLNDRQLSGKRIICHVPGEPRRYFAIPAHRHLMNRVGCWVTRSHQATRELHAVGSDATYIPYAISTDLFRPLDRGGPELGDFRRRWAIPTDRYLIGSFHRDSEGADLGRPKLVKGPDLFVEMVTAVHRAGAPVHVVLAGPRRHWVRNRLEQAAVPYSFVGEMRDADDVHVNILDRSTLNQLYNLLDLYIVSSRSEGGPQSIMEAAAARCPIVSSRVGLAEDILEPSCIYDDCARAVSLIEDDVRNRRLRETLDAHHDRAVSTHAPGAVAQPFKDLYARLDGIQVHQAPEKAKSTSPSLLHRIRTRIGRRARISSSTPLTVGVWHDASRSPSGGGTLFMSALTNALSASGVQVVQNALSPRIDVHLLDGVHFDIPAFERAAQGRRLRVVHRIDDTISIARGGDRGQVELCFRLNVQLASATVLRSAWTHERIVQSGYLPVNPVQIMDAVDPEIFSDRDRALRSPGKLRLISVNESDRLHDGGTIYRWLDQNLDWGRFDYSFVGCDSEDFTRIRRIDPVSPRERAGLFRQHDVFVFDGEFEPGSPALLEALACGLPTLYNDSGPNPAIVGHGGLPFTGTPDVLSRLETLTTNLAMFQHLIQVPTLNEVAERYLAILRDVAES